MARQRAVLVLMESNMAREPYDAPTTDELEAMFAGVEPPMSQGELVPQRGRDLGGGSMMVQDQIITAQAVNVPRDNAKILKGLQFAAAYAGQSVLTYRWLVNNRRTGKKDTVKGLTIKAADILLREYTNAFVDLRFTEGPSSWIYKATFCDIERGIARPAYWQEYKDTATLGARDKDDQRLKQIPFQVGQSKAIRNVIVKYLEIPYGAYLEAEAENNLVERVGKNMDAYRERCAKALADLGVDLVRVELQVGRKLADWLAPDLAAIVQQLKAVRDGMASANDQWPYPAPPEPRRNGEASPAASGPDVPATPPPANGEQPGPTQPHASAQAGSPPPAVDAPPAKNWRVGDDVLGQPEVIKRLGELCGMVESDADVDAIEQQNADRIARITGTRRAEVRAMFLDAKLRLAAARGGP
jgi:hypothetical protein